MMEWLTFRFLTTPSRLDLPIDRHNRTGTTVIHAREVTVLARALSSKRLPSDRAERKLQECSRQLQTLKHRLEADIAGGRDRGLLAVSVAIGRDTSLHALKVGSPAAPAVGDAGTKLGRWLEMDGWRSSSSLFTASASRNEQE